MMKKLILLLGMLILLSSFVSAAYNPFIYYKFDGDATDEGLLNINLKDGVTPTYVLGVINDAIDFEITDGDYVRNITVNGSELNKTRTIDVWVRRESSVNGQRVITIGKDAEVAVNEFHIREDNSKWKAALYIVGVEQFALSSDDILVNGAWYHIVVVMGIGGANLYINGTLNDNSTDENVMSSTFNTIVVGNRHDLLAPYDGTVDNVAFFEENYSVTDAVESFNSGAGTEFSIAGLPLSVNILHPENNTIYNSSSLDLNWTVDGNTTGCVYELDSDGTNISISTNISLTGLSNNNEHNVTIWCNDTTNTTFQSSYVYFNVTSNSLFMRNVGDNSSGTGQKGDSVNFSVEVKDYNGVDYCVLNTNVSGIFVNHTDIYGSPMYLSNESNVWEWTNFIFQNDTYGGHLGWYIFCFDNMSNSNGTSLQTFDFNNDTQAPAFSNFADNSNINFPQIGDTITLNATVTDFGTIDSCSLLINDTGDFVYVNNITVNTYNAYNLSLDYTIPAYNKVHTNISWRMWCNDTLGNAGSSIIQNFTVRDVADPNVTLGVGNGFSSNNRSVLRSAIENLSINITFFDHNLFQAAVNITCDINTSAFYWEVLDINTSNITLIDTVDLTGFPLQKCSAYMTGSDDHTAAEIDKYNIDKIGGFFDFNADKKGIDFDTTEDAKITILADDEKADVDSVEVVKLEDRYSVIFKYNDKKTERKYNVQSDKIVFYRKNSKYPAHFVIWDGTSKRGNWVDFNSEDTITSVEKINDTKYDVSVQNKDGSFIEEITFNSIGGTNIFNATVDFYIGAAVNLSGFNVYDNGTICNWTVTVDSITANPAWNGTVTVDGCNDILENITNGTYNLYFTHPLFFNKTYIINVTNTTQNVTYTSYQSIVNILGYNVKTNLTFINPNTTITNFGTNQIDTNTTGWDGVAIIATYFIDKGAYNYTFYAEGMDLNYTNNFTIQYIENLTVTAAIPYFGNFSLFDENIYGIFNVSGADRIEFLLYCPTSTESTIITTSNPLIPITCDYIKFKFVLTYGVVNYYRTFILDTNESNQVDIYLIDLLTTSYVHNSLIIDDLLADFDRPSIYVSKVIPTGTVQILADFIDIENKVGAFLIENHEYTLEVHSRNNPIKIIGGYSADASGDRIIKLYDITLDSTDTSTFGNAVRYSSGKFNDSTDTFAYASYVDESNLTQSVNWTLYSHDIYGDVIYSISTSSQNFELVFNISDYLNDSVVSYMRFEHPLGSQKDYALEIHFNATKSLGLEGFGIGTVWLNWFFIILIGTIALFSGIKSANYMALGVVGFATVFIIFGWFTLSTGVVAFAGLLALITILKTGEGDM